MDIQLVRLMFIAVATIGAAACSLRPLPAPQHACGGAQSLPAIWSCIDAMPRTPRVESGFRSTSRIATDLRVRSRNQSLTKACHRTVPEGFEHLEASFGDAAPLDAFYKRADDGRPTVIVVHGIFDSRANAFIRVTARRLADSGYGVLVPDMRWHGCLYKDAFPSTLGILEAGDLHRWSAWLRNEKRAGDIGLLGFSLGALDVIHAVAADEADEAYRAGAIAIAPPAYLPRVLAQLDTKPTFSDHGMNSIIRRTMRRYLRRRLGDAQVPSSNGALFAAYLRHLASLNLVGSTADEILESAEPLTRIVDIDVPTLVLVAKNDPLFGELVSNAYAAQTSNPRVHVIETPTGGHIGQVGEQPQWFSSIVTAYFEAVPRVARTP